MMKRTLLFFFLSISLFSSLDGYGQTWEWLRGAKSSGGGSSEGVYCATDFNGNLYSTGYFFGEIIFGNDTLTNYSGGSSAIFIVKYDSLGNVEWASSTTSGIAYPLGLSTDSYGNIYLFGGYDSTFKLGGMTLINTYSIPNTYFIAKLNQTGTVQWLKKYW